MARVTAGVELRVLELRVLELGVLEIDCDTLPAETREAIVATHPRPDFNRRSLHAVHAGSAHRPRVMFGNVKADVLDRFEEG